MLPCAALLITHSPCSPASPCLLLLPLQALANSAWALARLGADDPPLLAALLERATARQLEPQEACNMLWAACELGHAPEAATLAALLQGMRRQLHTYAPSDLSALMCGLARLGCPPPDDEWLLTLWEASSSRMADMQAGDVAALLWALAALRLLPPGEWCDAAAARSLALLERCRPRELALQVG